MLKESCVVAAAVAAVGFGCRAAVAADGAAPAESRAALSARIQAAPVLKVEELGAPVRGTRGGGVEWVPNSDGKTWDILLRYYDTYWGPHTTVIIDLGTGAVKRHERPRALIGWGCMGPDGKRYTTITGKKGVGFQVYDPDKNELHDLEAEIDTIGEVHPLSVGTDGLIYGAGSTRDNRAQVYRLNQQDGTIVDYGGVGPSHSPAPCWGYSVAADDRFVYVASGKNPWYLVAYDRETKKDTVLLTNDDPKGMISVAQQRLGCVASTRSPADPSANVTYWLYQGKLYPQVKGEPAPWPEVANAKPWVHNPPKPEVGGRLSPLGDGNVTLWYRTPEDKAAAKDVAVTDDTDPTNVGWKKAEFAVPTFAYDIHHLTPLADGRVIGSGGNYMGNFLYDPKSGTTTHLGILHLSIYSILSAPNGKVYLSGYPSSALYELDPDQPWTANEAPRPWLAALDEGKAESNPHRLTYLAHDGAGCHRMMAAVSAADGKVYFGGRWMRDGEGGGLGWWRTEEIKDKPAAGGLSEPFRNFQIHYLTTVGNGRYVVASTLAARDFIGNTPAPKTAKLFVFDTVAGAIVRTIEPVAGANATGPIAGVGGDRLLGITYDPADRELPDYDGKTDLSYGHMDKSSVLYLVNAVSGETIWQRALPYSAGFRMNENAGGADGFAFLLGPDGKVWTYTGGTVVLGANPAKSWGNSYLGDDLALVRINPADGAVEVVGRLDRPGGFVFSGRDLILDGGCKYLTDVNTVLRRIRNVVP